MKNTIKVLVVDDSVVIRRLLTTIIDDDPDLEVAGTAPNGRIALQRVESLRPDVVTLDIEMPELDGLGTLKELRKRHTKLPVIMFSTLTERGGAATLEALSLGASDYVTKPANVGSVGVAMERVRDELVPKIKALCKPHVTLTFPPLERAVVAGPKSQRIDLVAIGSSTGGPNALAEVMTAIGPRLPVPVVITQHMPPVFTAMLADRLDAASQLTVHEGADGITLEPGNVYIAPGGRHMVVQRHGLRVEIATNEDPPENFCRPAVDVMYRSVAEAYGGNVLAVVLTGMGSDGRNGTALLRARGAHVLVQDQATSVVWGMPGAVATAGLADEVLPLAAIGPMIDDKVRAAQPLLAGWRS